MSAIWCAGCGRVLEPGTALRVTVRATGRTFHVHRDGVSENHCLKAAGPAHATSIELEDPAAAREHDHAAGGSSNYRREAERLAFFASHTPGGPRR